MQDVVNYLLNKFMPFIVLGAVLFLSLGFKTWEPYVVLGLTGYIAHFHYGEGFSVAYCEENNLLKEDTTCKNDG